jgi:hypothetical protein
LVPDFVLPQAAPASAPPVVTTVAPAASHTNSAATPTAQVAPVLVSLAQTPEGTQRMTLHLQPDTLGHVQIQIERLSDAAAKVDITVQRQHTLDLLLHDQPQLQHALDQAGVPQEGRTLTLHLATPENTASSFGAQSGAWSDGRTGNGFNGHGSSRSQGDPNRDAGADPDTRQPASPARQYRAGLDITA